MESAAASIIQRGVLIIQSQPCGKPQPSEYELRLMIKRYPVNRHLEQARQLYFILLEKQVRKLEDVIEIKVLDPADSVYRELIMVKIRADRKERAEIISVADIFRAKIVDVEQESLIVELTGTQSKLEAFLSLLEGYEILELARTGITGLNRGIKDVTLIDQEGNIRKI